MYPSKRALIIGNGVSRRGYDLHDASKLGLTTFGCNRIVDEFLPDYVVAIDPIMINCLYKSPSVPNHRVLVPLHNEHWEPAELGGRRSNAGCNAILEAIKRDFEVIVAIGMDFLIDRDDMACDNVYATKPEYQQRATCDDNKNRLTYLRWIVQKRGEGVRFRFLFPDHAIPTKTSWAESLSNVSIEYKPRLTLL